MNVKNVINGILIAISYHSLKKVVERVPPPYRGTMIFLFRLCVFLIVFLSLFSFFTSRISTIASNVVISSVIADILIGICFIISLVIGFLLTAVIEEVYRKISENLLRARQKFEVVKEKSKIPPRVIKNSIRSTGKTLSKTGKWIYKSINKVYGVSKKVTEASVDKVTTVWGKLFKR